MSKEPLQPEGGKGFAGLDSLISDVADDVKAATTQPSTKSTTSAPPTRIEPSASTPSAAGSIAPPRSGNGTVLIVVVGIVGLIVALLLFAESNKTSLPSEAQRTVPSPSPTASRVVPNSVPTPAPSAPKPEYERPPVGQDLVLSAPQIRYCLREKIRLDALDGVLNARSQYEVDRFNALVEDYNSRCGKFRYRRGDLDRVKQEVEQLRSSISSAAILEWRR